MDLAIALARHLGGAFRPAGGSFSFVPDPHRCVALTVWSTLPLGPDTMLLVVQPELPAARLQGDEPRDWRVRRARTDTSPWTLDADDPMTLDVAEALTDERRAEVEDISRAA